MAPPVLRGKAVVRNKKGIHARPSSLVVEEARKFASRITLRCNGIDADAKRLFDVLSLGADKGAEIEIEVSGPDAPKAMEAIKELLEKQFPYE